MIKQTLYFGNPAYLNVRNKQLVINRNDEVRVTIPLEDIGIILLDHPQITVTHTVIRNLQANNAVIISCDEKHMPYSLMLPMVAHTEQMKAQRAQLAASEPLKKHLWQQCIHAKIINQSIVLEKQMHPNAFRLSKLAEKVLSGDRSNVEGHAAAIYWSSFQPDFYRDQYGEPPNNYLNYGYTILRAMVARALVGAGLLPTIGIHHKSKYNPFCLADDIMEAFRPFVDLIVLDMIEENDMEQFLSQNTRGSLLEIATVDAFFSKKKRPLMVGLEETAASLRKCFEGTKRKLILPRIP